MAASNNDLDMDQLMGLVQNLDLQKVAALAERVDLNALIGAISQMDEGTLAQMQRMMARDGGERREPPPIDGDFYHIEDLLADDEAEVMHAVRRFMEDEVEPIINDYWLRDETPRELLVEGLRKLDLPTLIYGEDLSTRESNGSLLEGIATMEMARVDVSTATFFGVHAGLAMQSILICGSEEQKAEWLPKMRTLDVLGSFGLTEPKVGSAVSGGLTTTCRREGEEWVLNGQKKWIGNATFADLIIVWARDEDSGEVLGFIVRKGAEGLSVEKMRGKIALRAVENGLVTLEDVRIPESDRLQGAESFRQTAEVLRVTRAGVAWQAVGCAMGAYERSLRYSRERKQFGRPIASFQMIQDKLVYMLGNVTAMQTMCLRLSRLQDEGRMTDEQASLAKVYTAARCRDTVALARDLHGGNGILLENHVARYFCDCEAIYSYEGTNEINSLIVGRAITGISAFV
jgi:glutaryl-CoA dehydrogenase